MMRATLCLAFLLLSACSTVLPAQTAAAHAAQALRWERQFKACALAYVDRYPSAQAAANQAQQAVAVCSAVLSAYQLRQRDTYLASQQPGDKDTAWAQAAADGRRLEQATLALVQLHLESAVTHPALP